MSATAQAAAFGFVERLAQDLKDEQLELPAFPEAVLRVQRALQAEDTSAEDIVRILSSEPALAARLLRISNSVEFRRAESEITDLRQAVSRMGFNMVRSVAVSFAMRQLRRKDSYSPAVQAQLQAAWKESLQIAAVCFVLAKRFTRLNADQALLTGLLHVLGRLYIIMRAQEMDNLGAEDLQEVVSDWHATIGKAILESWGLPDALQAAVEHQNAVTEQFEGPVTLTDVLISAKVLAHGANNAEPVNAADYPALQRLGVAASDKVLGVMDDYVEEIQAIRASLGE